jgi:hypothetical protein
MSDETECKCPGFWESDLCITVRDVPTIFTFCGDEPTTREPSKADIPGGRFCARLARDLYGDDPCDKAQVDWCGCCDTAAFFTAPDFGCVLHEPAGPSGEDQTKP